MEGGQAAGGYYYIFGMRLLLIWSLVLGLGAWWQFLENPRRALSSKAKVRLLMNLLARIAPYGIDGTHPRSEMPD